MLEVVWEEEIPSGNIILLVLTWEPEVMQRSDYAKNSRWVGQMKDCEGEQTREMEVYQRHSNPV